MEALMYETMAEVHARVGDTETALKMLQEGHRRRPMGDLNFRIALIYDQCGQHANAVEYFRRALIEDSPEKTQAVRDIIDSKLHSRTE
jgi:tetratricopeptide (TPR) repeat protein